MMLKEKIIIYSLLVAMCLGITIGTFWGNIGGIIAGITTTITAVISAIAVYYQIKKDAQVTQAEFLLEFSKVFYSYEGAILLEAKIDEASDKGQIYVYTTNDYELLNDYMLWLEALATMVENNTLSIELINDLYNYRFFSVVNNPTVQEHELCVFAQYYKSIFVLHKKWVAYRNKHKQFIINQEYDLSKHSIYLKTLD